jgi:predicted acyltransferase
MTFADLIFPMFMFIMGVSMYFSLSKFQFRISRSMLFGVVKRAVLMYLVGTFIYGFDLVLHTGGDFASLTAVRLSGVLERLAVCYLLGSLLVCALRSRAGISICVTLILVGYYVILCCGAGFDYSEWNILGRIDRALLGVHMYSDGGIDPEGVLSTLPAIAQVLIGFCVGGWCMEKSPLENRLLKLFALGTALLCLGFACADFCPINKKVWSPTFVLVTCGFSSLLLALLIWVVDYRKSIGGIRALEVVGVNPLFCYVASELLYSAADVTVHESWYAQLISWFGGDATFASLVYALLFLLVVWLIADALYRRRILIKL